MNNTKVVPARLFGRKNSGGKVEILVLEHEVTGDFKNDTRWCLLKASKRPAVGSRLIFEDLAGKVEALGEEGIARITFQGPRSIDDLMEEKGEMPLPPYIKRVDGRLFSLDRERYQTVFSKKKGAIAAPTAGLHFSESAIEKLEENNYPASAVRKRAESKVSTLEFDKLDMYCRVLKEKIGSIRDSISANQSLLAMEKTKIEKGFYSEGS